MISYSGFLTYLGHPVGFLYQLLGVKVELE